MKHSVSQVRLANGIQGLLIHIPDASVMTTEINFRAGEYLLDREKWETAHLMEHILLGANEQYPRARDFQAEVEKNGAYCNASTGVYDITYESECADFEWDRILELLLLAITKPLFLEDEFRAEFGNVKEELTARSNNHFRHLGLALREQYGLCAMTDQVRLQKMQNVSVDDVRNHYLDTHTTNNMRFVIAGNITAKRRAKIEALLRDTELPVKQKRPSLPLEKPKKLASPLYIPAPGLENIYFYIDTFMSQWINNAQIDALSLANNMLTETLHSRIYGAAREQGLVYSMSSSYARWKGGSNWWFAAQVSKENAPKLFDIITKEVQNIRAGRISEQDLVSAKQYALGRYQRSAQTVSGTASGYSSRYFFDDYVGDYYKIPERIEAVTKAQIVQIANDMFGEKIGSYGVLGDCGEDYVDSLKPHIAELWK